MRLDAGLAAEFLDQNRARRSPAGTVVANPALGLTLSEIRLDRADGFYKGDCRRAHRRLFRGAGRRHQRGRTGRRCATLQGPARRRGAGGVRTWLPGARTGAGAFTGGVDGQSFTP